MLHRIIVYVRNLNLPYDNACGNAKMTEYKYFQVYNSFLFYDNDKINNIKLNSLLVGRSFSAPTLLVIVFI